MICVTYDLNQIDRKVTKPLALIAVPDNSVKAPTIPKVETVHPITKSAHTSTFKKSAITKTRPAAQLTTSGSGSGQHSMDTSKDSPKASTEVVKKRKVIQDTEFEEPSKPEKLEPTVSSPKVCPALTCADLS